jgi:CO/xanthine dehydrogenase Mo-binding subunit
VSDRGARAPHSNVPRSIGARIPRREDRRLLTGRGTYVDDVYLPRMLHAAFARSSEAHARLLVVDGAEARSLPGVVAVFTAAELEVDPNWIAGAIRHVHGVAEPIP